MLQLLGWGLYFYAQASGEVIFASEPWSKAAALWGGIAVAGMGLTHGLRWTVKRRDWLALAPVALWGRIVLAVLVMTTVAWILSRVLTHATYNTDVAPIVAAFYQRLSPSGQLRNQFIILLAVHSAWVAAYLALAMQRHRYRVELRQAQLGKSLQAAELRLLKAQLNPHFLFNALNGLRSLIADEPERARDAVTHLSRTLRYTFASGDDDLVSLERELEMVDDYLALESMRLVDRLRVERDIDAAARTVRIPVMLLQTLVENGIKHGISALKEGGTLRITARVRERELVLQVLNPRPMEAVPPPIGGVGLKNCTERLRLLYGERARLALDLSQAGIATAEVTLPS